MKGGLFSDMVQLPQLLPQTVFENPVSRSRLGYLNRFQAEEAERITKNFAKVEALQRAEFASKSA